MKYKYIFGRLGKEIIKIRKEKGLSQEDLAFDSSLDRTTVAVIEEGKNNLTVKTLLKIASNLDIKLWQLFKRIDP
ncbi:transcriptional regulator [Candidatus Roizmanbacteria bacterium CG_4_10_14_0_8_um_filter_33_9]|uniref:Transcriptional regulator n=1 Tax=Candidatus Roizmanbacteria bacterium CG_4_10_14_0_8_um_filter_33_9 TaxID=1974826 RepID=A0A2M7QJM3_9BACT|nr:MAG: transcriptional regulator [Candidatus Roizmanbacteria bacterium CG_4_10_14_0_8_um_filter_33_9]